MTERNIEFNFLPYKQFISKKIKTKDGKLHDVYSIGALSQATGRDVHTLRQWEKKKWIPKPIITLKNSSRFYLKEEIKAYVWAMGVCEMRTGVNVAKSGFPKLIREELGRVQEQFNERIQKNLKDKE